MSIIKKEIDRLRALVKENVTNDFNNGKTL